MVPERSVFCHDKFGRLLKTSLLKALDAVAYPAACFVGAALARGPQRGTVETLIIRPGGMGDLICADMALTELGCDSRDFTWLIETRSRPWADYRKLPYLCYDAGPWRTLWKIRRRYGRVINMEQFFGLSQAYALAARGRRGRLVSFATNRAAHWGDAVVEYDWRNQHETVEFARLLAEGLHLPRAGTPRHPRSRLRAASAPPLVLVAGQQSRSRCLALEDWVRLISEWRHGRSLLVAASPQDQAFAGQLQAGLGGAVERFEGSFTDLCEQIACSEEVFTLDGGAVHMASWFGVPTTAIFTSGREQKWYPLGEGSRLLRREDLPCQPCTKFGQVPSCPHGYACLRIGGYVPLKPSPYFR